MSLRGIGRTNEINTIEHGNKKKDQATHIEAAIESMNDMKLCDSNSIIHHVPS